MEVFMTLVGLLLLGYFAYLAIDRFPALKNFFKPGISRPDILKKEFWLQVGKNPDIKKRALFTLGIIVVYKLGYMLPIPGIDFSAISGMTSRFNPESAGSAFNMMSGLSDSIMEKSNIFTLGLMPYLSACLLLQIAGVIIRPLRKHFFSGEQGRVKVVRYSLGLAMFLCILQSFMSALWLENPRVFMGISIVQNPGWGFRILATLSMTAGFCLILWLAGLITRKGIGQGVAVLVFSDVVVGLFSKIRFAVFGLKDTTVQPIFYVVGAVMLAGLFLIAVFVTVWKKDVLVSVGGKEIGLPIRITWVGREPISWGQGLILLPATIASFSANRQWQDWAGRMMRGQAPYYIAYLVLIMACAYLYKAIVFNARNVANLVEKHEGAANESQTKERITNIFQGESNNIIFFVGLLLLILAVVPDGLMAIFQVPYLVASVFSGMGILVIVGVLYDIQEQIKAKLEKEKTNCQTICYVAFDEIEATIKKGFLESKNIPCVVEPLRFTWGMPIRTAVDEYRLNVAESNSKTAKELLA